MRRAMISGGGWGRAAMDRGDLRVPANPDPARRRSTRSMRLNCSPFPPQGFSRRWYRAFADSDSFVEAFKFSLMLAAVSSVIATLIGFFAAYGIQRTLIRRRELGKSLALLPVMVPHVLIGMSLLLALTVVPLPEAVALVGGHIVIAVPSAIAAIPASLDGVDASAWSTRR